MTVYTYASPCRSGGLAPPSAQISVHFQFLCGDVERDKTMNKTLETSKSETLTYTQQLTDTDLFPMSQESSEEHPTSMNPLSVPFTIYEHSLETTPFQSVGWLWEKRLPRSGITILDGDHNCGKSLLALQIAAAVSSGTLMPDGTPTVQGGVVIVTPHLDASTTQLQLLTALGADLSRVEILTYVQEPTSSPHTGDARPFSLPEDFTRLFQAIQRVDARLVILDPFISLLSCERRWTELRLSHLLADLNQRFIERNVACLLIRNCPAKGGHARPPILERSDFFLITAVSRLLLAHDPMQPDRLLLCHAHSRHSALEPSLILHINPLTTHPSLARINVQGTHQLSAHDFLEYRPDVLHRRLLFQHLQTIIADTTDPVPVSTLYAQSPHSSPFQIQRTLNDLLRMGQIDRPARGFYAKAPADPVFPPKASTTPEPKPETDAEIHAPEPEDELNEPAAKNPSSDPTNELTTTDIITQTSEATDELKESAAKNPSSDPANELKESAAITQTSELTKELNVSAAINQTPEPTEELNMSAATDPTLEPTTELKITATINPSTEPANTPASTETTKPRSTTITTQMLSWLTS